MSKVQLVSLGLFLVVIFLGSAFGAKYDGQIYSLTDDGRLFWYKHEGVSDGSNLWANGQRGKPLGDGWNFKQLFSGGQGVIYALTDDGRLFWYKHEGVSDGSYSWANNQVGKPQGSGWNFKQVFSGM